MSCSINLKNISYKKDDYVLFENVIIDLKHKEKIAIIGKNGVGKTTLLKIIAGLQTPSAGTIELFHNRINSSDDFEKFRDKIAYLPQNINSFFLTISVIEDVMFSLRTLGINKEKAYKKSIDILKKLDILHLENRVIYELSGGEKKIVALAVILVKEPEILLLDEPTNDLDESSEKRVLEILNNTEKSMIIVSHKQAFLDKLVSKTYHLEDKTLKY